MINYLGDEVLGGYVQENNGSKRAPFKSFAGFIRSLQYFDIDTSNINYESRACEFLGFDGCVMASTPNEAIDEIRDFNPALGLFDDGEVKTKWLFEFDNEFEITYEQLVGDVDTLYDITPTNNAWSLTYFETNGKDYSQLTQSTGEIQKQNKLNTTLMIGKNQASLKLNQLITVGKG